MRETEFDVTHYRHEHLLHKVNMITDLKITLRDITDTHVGSHVQSFRAYEFNHTRETLFVTTTATSNRPEACEDALSGTFRVLDDAASVIQLDGRQRLQALRDL